MKTLLRRFPVLGLVVVFTLWAGAALAHKVNVFAVAEGGAVSGEGYFSGGAKAQSVPVEIHDASGAVIAQGVTEKDGTFKITLPASVSPPLRIVLKAGDGHQNDFTLTAKDLGQGAPGPSPAASAQAPVTGQGASTAATVPAPPAKGSGQSVTSAPGPSPAALDEAKLTVLIEAAVAKAVDEKLAPLRLQLSRMAETDQSSRMQGIIGGIGWIVGLVGIAAWFKRPKG